jgi:hypothetical protein
VTSIKSNYLPHYYSIRYEKLRASALMIETMFRSYNQHKKYEHTKKSATKISKIGKGYNARKRYAVMKKRLPKYAAPILQKGIRIFLVSFFLLFSFLGSFRPLNFFLFFFFFFL